MLAQVKNHHLHKDTIGQEVFPMRDHSGLSKVWLLPVLAIAIAGGIVIAVHTARVRRARLVLQVPTPVLPNPNAYDTFCQAGDALVDKEDITEASKPGSSLYLQQRVVAENARAMGLLRQGLNYQYLHPPVRSFDARFPYGEWRTLARLMGENSQVLAANGDWDGAVRSAVDTINFGTCIPHGAPVIGTLVGIAVQVIGQDQLWSTVDHLSASQARVAMQELAFLSAHEVSSSTVMQEELWWSYASLQKEFLNGNQPLSSGATGDASVSPNSRMIRQKMIDVFTDTMLKGIENSRLPYARQKRLPEPRGPMAIAANLLAPDSRKVSFKITENHTRNLLLMTALALRAYRCEHGSYPATLQALTPKYVTSLPDDPFGLRGTFHYRPQGDVYLLYSVGPDGTDNGGTPMVGTANPGETMKRCNPESIGDLVAGRHA